MNMKLNINHKWLLSALIAVFLAILGVIALKNEGDSNDKVGEISDNKQNVTERQNNVAQNPTYLVIKEWGIKVQLPNILKDHISYKLNDAVTDSDGNILQNATILIAANSLSSSQCTPFSNEMTFIDTGAQYIRSEREKPFNESRYRWTFQKNIFSDSAYNYHLNYLTPPCLKDSDILLVESLQKALFNPETSE